LPRLSVGNSRMPTPFLPPFQHPTAERMQFGLGAVLHLSKTPSLHAAGFEDEDEDEMSKPYRPAVPQCNDTVSQVSDPAG
jgi:hypothetical protein